MSDTDAHLAASLAVALVPHFHSALPKRGAEEVAVLALVAMSQSKETQIAPTHTIRREIKCLTYLRRLHVTAQMVRSVDWGGALHTVKHEQPMTLLLPQVDTLLPDMTVHMPRNTMRSLSNRSLFKQNITIVDLYNRTHAVTYECLVSSGQRHARLSAGWGALMRRLNVELGDVIVLEMHGDRNDGVLYVRVERGGGEENDDEGDDHGN